MSEPNRPQPEQRCGHPPMKYSQKLADAFGIQPAIDVPEAPREVVAVDSIPDPPEFQAPGAPTPARQQSLDLDETVHNIIRDEMDEMGLRLERYGVRCDAGQKQELIDHAMAILGGFARGGAIARR